MSLEERRKDYVNVPVLVQKFDDFIENTKLYRKTQEEIQTRIACELEHTNKEITKKIEDLSKAVLCLPCEKREAIYTLDKKAINDNIRGLWYTVLVVIVGGVVFGVWLKVFLK